LFRSTLTIVLPRRIDPDQRSVSQCREPENPAHDIGGSLFNLLRK